MRGRGKTVSLIMQLMHYAASAPFDRHYRVALAAADGDPGQAREMLGIGKTTYYAKLKQLGLGGQTRER